MYKIDRIDSKNKLIKMFNDDVMFVVRYGVSFLFSFVKVAVEECAICKTFLQLSYLSLFFFPLRYFLFYFVKH